MKSKKIIGYTVGCYDMFHIGHLNILKRASEQCDTLIVGVNSDETMYSYKQRYPVIPEDERLEIVKSVKFVDEAMLADSIDQKLAYEKTGYDIIFIGDDHKGEVRWSELDNFLIKKGSKVQYLPYTGHTSSTIIRDKIDQGVIS